MSHALDDCIERLDWAIGHLETLKPAIGDHNINPDSDPLFRFDLDFDAGTLEMVVRHDPVLPNKVGLVFGEVVRGLHATLDNLVYALGRLNTTIPPSDKFSAFPIIEEERAWFSPDTFKKVQYLSREHRTRVESYQPFMRNGGLQPKQDALARIAAYSNEDKHKVIVSTAASPLEILVDSIRTHHCRVASTETHKLVRLRKDAVVLRATLADVGADASVHMDGTIEWMPVLQNDEPIQTFCVTAASYVRMIVESFRPAFEP